MCSIRLSLVSVFVCALLPDCMHGVSVLSALGRRWAALRLLVDFQAARRPPRTLSLSLLPICTPLLLYDECFSHLCHHTYTHVLGRANGGRCARLIRPGRRIGRETPGSDSPAPDVASVSPQHFTLHRLSLLLSLFRFSGTVSNVRTWPRIN